MSAISNHTEQVLSSGEYLKYYLKGARLSAFRKELFINPELLKALELFFAKVPYSKDQESFEKLQRKVFDQSPELESVFNEMLHSDCGGNDPNDPGIQAIVWIAFGAGLFLTLGIGSGYALAFFMDPK
ncbi:MAG: hypothetical protein Crog4KO_05700 [Crocinitomicaceae bacterium]